ncbi:PDZ domain-containing protein [Botrimarina sp.]|uniref:PDZ domain-containing protein n=1 Tax=Botrimarina sp. TaxID=2795802 RepID=UPI0032EE3B13
MTRTLAIAALAASLAAAPAALAGGCNKGGGQWRPVHPVHPAPAPAVRPIGWHPQPVAPTHRDWYFGMSLEIQHTQYGRGLRVASVTHGSPADRAGLEVGDVLLAANQVSLAGAVSNEHGVTLVNQAMSQGQAPAPAAAVTTAVAYVQPQSQMQFTVLDRRSGQPVYVAVAPHRVGGYPAPAPAAPAFGAPAPSAPRPAAPAVTTF